MLSKYQGYLSHHTVVMTIKAERVGGEALEFNEYTPPDDGYIIGYIKIIFHVLVTLKN